MPGSGESRVLVSSRCRLVDPECSRTVRLGTLDDVESPGLLARINGCDSDDLRTVLRRFGMITDRCIRPRTVGALCRSHRSARRNCSTISRMRAFSVPNTSVVTGYRG